jgi:hypothetical protein
MYLLAAFLLIGADAAAQSRFLYGMYAMGWGENEGIYWTGSTFGSRTGPSGARLMNFWYDSLGMNTFFVNSSNFPEGGEDNAPYVNYLYKDYAADPRTGRNFIRDSRIIPIYRCFLITRAAESHYLKFSPPSRYEGNIINFDSSAYSISAGDTAFTVTARTAPASGRIIRDLTIVGGENRQIRPREWNTRRSLAYFKLRFRLESARAGHVLTVSLINKASRAGRKNYQLIDKRITLASGKSEVVLPFTLDMSGGESQYEAYACRIGLQVSCTMSIRSSFRIRDITAYDDSGRVVVEETAKFFNTPKRRALVKAFTDIAAGIATSSEPRKVYPIIAVADEPHVGNYAPMDAVCSYLLRQDTRLTFYSTWPDDELYHTNLTTVTRFAKINLHYIAPNHYLFRPDVLDHRRSIYRDYEVLSRFCAHVRSVAPNKTIISVPPIFSAGSEFRPPTQSEILSSAYVSLLVGAQGVVFYYSGPFAESEQTLYAFHDLSGQFEKMFSLRNMHAHKVAALRRFAAFIHGDSGEPAGLSNGDFVSTLGVDEYAIVGTTDGVDVVNSRSFRQNELGNATRTDIARITIVDAGGTMVSNANLVGVAHLADNPSIPDVTYFLVTNLHSSDRDVRLRISFRSSHSRAYLRVNNLTYPADLTNRTVSRSGTVTTTLPAQAAMILKIQNSSTP